MPDAESVEARLGVHRRIKLVRRLLAQLGVSASKAMDRSLMSPLPSPEIQVRQHGCRNSISVCKRFFNRFVEMEEPPYPFCRIRRLHAYSVAQRQLHNGEGIIGARCDDVLRLKADRFHLQSLIGSFFVHVDLSSFPLRGVSASCCFDTQRISGNTGTAP